MIGARSFGISLCEKGLRAVVLKKHRRGTQIAGWTSQPWPSGCLKPGFREPNVLAEEPFAATVRAALKSLGTGKCRVALSLSDTVGRMLITTLDEPLKSGQEGINLLKWQVREQLPVDPEQVRLAFRVIDAGPGGKSRVLVAAADNAVLEQYETLLAAAGATPALILFESLNVMHHYQAGGILDGHHLLIVLTPAALTLQLHIGGRLHACRSRSAPGSETVLFQEVGRTLADWERTWPEARDLPAFLHGAPPAESWMEALEGALSRAPKLPPQQTLPLAPALAKQPPPHCYGALGGAERLFRGLP
jgi:type IV pilus assembly protein PilM